MAAEMSAKDNKINDLVEELGATQALLTEKEHALQEVCPSAIMLTGLCMHRKSNHSGLTCQPSNVGTW